jgi:hypothetical protein
MKTGTIKFENALKRRGINPTINVLDNTNFIIDDIVSKYAFEFIISDMDKVIIIKSESGYVMAEDYKLDSDGPFVREYTKFDMDFKYAIEAITYNYEKYSK